MQVEREIHHAIEVLQWQGTDGAHKKPPVGYPDRLPIEAEEIQALKDAQPPVPEALAVDEMRQWLGWPEPPKED